MVVNCICYEESNVSMRYFYCPMSSTFFLTLQYALKKILNTKLINVRNIKTQIIFFQLKSYALLRVWPFVCCRCVFYINIMNMLNVYKGQRALDSLRGFGGFST